MVLLNLEDAEAIEGAEVAADRLAEEILASPEPPHPTQWGALRGWVRLADAVGLFRPSDRHRAAIERLPRAEEMAPYAKQFSETVPPCGDPEESWLFTSPGRKKWSGVQRQR